MAASSAEYRDVLRHFPAGVTVVTLRAGEEIHGLTVSAFASVSPEPPLVAVMIDHRHRAFELLELPGAVFAVNFLGVEQRALSDRFAWGKESERFAGVRWEIAATGAPVLPDAVAWLDCAIHSRHRAGTHTLFIGEVREARVARPEAAPLVYWNRDYRALDLGAPPPPESTPSGKG